jgi:hypothetical protein
MWFGSTVRRIMMTTLLMSNQVPREAAVVISKRPFLKGRKNAKSMFLAYFFFEILRVFDGCGLKTMEERFLR